MSKQNNIKKIVGLNSRYGFEDEQFVNFFLLVQAKANEQGKIFYIDCGEGNIALIGDTLAMDLGRVPKSGVSKHFRCLKEVRLFPKI